METDNLRWRELTFRNQEVRTDSVYYLEKSGLLLPAGKAENLFRSSFTKNETRFFIGSDDSVSLRRLDLFFQRVYQTVSSPCDFPELDYGDVLFLSNSIMNRKVRNFYSPSFVRKIFDIIHASDLDRLGYEIAIRTPGPGRTHSRFNFILKIWTDTPDGLGEVRDLIMSAIRDLKKDSKWRFRVGRKRTSTDLLSNPRNLINFLRIPSENDVFQS